MTPAQTPERPVTWSDIEIEKAACVADRSFVKVNVPFFRNFLAALGAVHPAEVREREREAWAAALDWHHRQRGLAGHLSAAEANERDVRYPSLLPASPPPLVLANGTRVERSKSGYRYVITAPTGTKYHGNSLSPLGAYCTTDEDFTAIAKWLQEAK